ncbi:hypothetical protein MTO96_052085 [Rhipicephalus appendiculatus]
MHAGPTDINPWAATTISSPCKSTCPRASRVRTPFVIRNGTRFVLVASTLLLPTSTTFCSGLTSYWRTSMGSRLRSPLRQATQRLTPALLTCGPLIQASPTGGTSNDIIVVFAAESHTSTGRSKRTPPSLLASSGNSCAWDIPVSWALSNHGIFYAIFSTQRLRNRSPGSNCSV